MTIPTDIQAALGDLTNKQRGVIECLLSAIGEERARTLVRDAQEQLERSNAHTPTAPKTVRSALATLLVPERTSILGIPLPRYVLLLEGHARWLVRGYP